MKSQRTHYEVMGVATTATQDQIRDKYHEMARKFHPDRTRVGSSQRLFAQINMAYATLRDPNKRAHYDLSLQDVTGMMQAYLKQAGSDTSIIDNHIAAGRNQATTAGSSNVASSGKSNIVLAAEAVQCTITSAAAGEAEAHRAFLRGDADKAIELCLQVIKLDPRAKEACELLGDAYKSKGKTAEAIAAYQHAVDSGDKRHILQQKISRLQTAPAAPPAAKTAPQQTGKSNQPGKPGQKPNDQKPSGLRKLFSR